MTGKLGEVIKLSDAYNTYFIPDSQSAIVVVESLERLEFRDPQTMALKLTVPVPGCHADFSSDGDTPSSPASLPAASSKSTLPSQRRSGH
jgi:hypothetical protein